MNSIIFLRKIGTTISVLFVPIWTIPSAEQRQRVLRLCNFPDGPALGSPTKGTADLDNGVVKVFDGDDWITP